MKSRNLNLKHDCVPCKRADQRKKARLDREFEEKKAQDDIDNNNDVGDDDESETDDEDIADVSGSEVKRKRSDEDIADVSGSEAKRKRSGEHHSHCHCPLFKVTEPLLEFMGGGQPYRRFEADQLKRKEAAKVDRVLNIQKQKLDRIKYEGDLKREIIRFKGALKLFNRNMDRNHNKVNRLLF